MGRFCLLPGRPPIGSADKARLAKIVSSANVEAVTIPSTAGRQERDRVLRDFVKKAERVQHGEVVLVFWAFCASGILGRRTVSTPLSKDASILSASTPSGTLNARLKEPISGAYRADGRGAYCGELAKNAK